MPLAAYALPFGIRDVKVFPMNADGSYATGVDLPASRTLTFQESEDFEELRGDDVVVASRGSGPTVSWDLEGGGLSPDAIKVIAGGTVVVSGTTPNQKRTLAKLGVDTRPYFKIEGQVISDSGGDIHAIIYKAQAQGDVGGEFSEGSFFLSGASGIGIPDNAGKLFDFVQNETAVAIVP
jgi:hypothetical protein